MLRDLLRLLELKLHPQPKWLRTWLSNYAKVTTAAAEA